MQNPFGPASREAWRVGPAFWKESAHALQRAGEQGGEPSEIGTRGERALEEGAAFLWALSEALAKALGAAGIPAFRCPHLSYREYWRGLVHLPSPENNQLGLVFPYLTYGYRLDVRLVVRDRASHTWLASRWPRRKTGRAGVLLARTHLSQLDDIDGYVDEALRQVARSVGRPVLREALAKTHRKLLQARDGGA